MSKKKLLITGGCGFIGSNLVRRLSLDDQFQITVIDNLKTGRSDVLDDLNVELVVGDILDQALLDEVLPGCGAVVHLAADTRVIDSVNDPGHNFDVNTRGTFGLLEAMRKHGIGRLVNASTGGAIIGDVEPPVNEEMPARPTSPYGASKLAAEGYCSAFTSSYGMEAVSLRFSNVYGPLSYHKGSVVAAFFRRILADEPLIVYGDGSQQRDYIFVEDLVAGIEAALGCRATGPIQLGTGKGTTLNELLRIIKEVVGEPDLDVRFEEFRDGEVRDTYCDISRARELLGFEPGTSLNDGLSKTWQWFLGQHSARPGSAA